MLHKQFDSLQPHCAQRVEISLENCLSFVIFADMLIEIALFYKVCSLSTKRINSRRTVHLT